MGPDTRDSTPMGHLCRSWSEVSVGQPGGARGVCSRLGLSGKLTSKIGTQLVGQQRMSATSLDQFNMEQTVHEVRFDACLVVLARLPGTEAVREKEQLCTQSSNNSISQ